MKQAFKHFLFGFGSSINLFGGSELLKLSEGGFRADYNKLKQDGQKIQKTFAKVVDGKKCKTRSSY